MGNPYNFEERARIPVRPLSYENKDMAIPKEFIIDYTNCVAYVMLEDGQIFNISSSEATIKEICTYLESHPSNIANLNIITRDGNTLTIAAAFEEVFRILDDILADKYIKKTGDGVTGDLFFGNGVQIKGEYGNMLTMQIGGRVELSNDNSTTYIKGLTMISSKNYGTDDPPSDGIEGQIYFKLIDE